MTQLFAVCYSTCSGHIWRTIHATDKEQAERRAKQFCPYKRGWSVVAVEARKSA